MACFWPLFASVGLIKLISNSSRQERFLKSFARYAQRFSNRTLRLCWSLILPGYVTKINQISLNCGLRLTSSCRVHGLKCLREVVIVFSTRQLIIELRAAVSSVKKTLGTQPKATRHASSFYAKMRSFQ